MKYRKMPAELLPARPSALRAEHVPNVPEWFPLDRGPDENGEPRPPYTDAERRELRQRWRRNEACTGPFDRQRVVVTFDEQTGPPQSFVPVGSPSVRYVLDRDDSTEHKLAYRYDPTCAMHAPAMRAIEEAFTEYGREYAIASTQEATHDRSAPTQL